MVSVRLYIEGGGDSKALRTECRRGFAEFVKKGGLALRMPRIVACGGRQGAYKDFRIAAEQAAGQGVPMLLVDAEEPVQAGDPWEHLQARDGWTRPVDTTDDQCHLMVQVMESWFLTDVEALAKYYMGDFQRNALPANQEVEAIPKADVLSGLTNATKHTQKGAYSKGSHSFAILALIDAAKVEKAAPHARRFFAALRSLLKGTM